MIIFGFEIELFKVNYIKIVICFILILRDFNLEERSFGFVFYIYFRLVKESFFFFCNWKFLNNRKSFINVLNVFFFREMFILL